MDLGTDPVSETAATLRRRILPLMEKTAEGIRRLHPHVKANAFMYPIGAATERGIHAYIVDVDCCLSTPVRADWDNVALLVEVSGLPEDPRLEAYVAWGPGDIETELFAEPLRLSDEGLHQVEDGLPLLVDSLSSAIQRGGPSKS